MRKPEEGERPQATGIVPIKLAEEPNKFTALVPESYSVKAPHGLVVVLQSPGEFDEKAFVARWKPIAEDRQLLVLSAQPAEEGKWKPAETGVIRKGIERVIDEYRIDRNRVVIYGYQAGGVMAWIFTGQNMELVRGLAVVDALPPGNAGHAGKRSATASFVLPGGSGEVARGAALAAHGSAPLSKENFPVTLKTLPAARDLEAEELAEFARWVDSLDRI